jgi:hypothetical protein
MSKKIDLAKEAKKIVEETEVEGEVTEAVLNEYCPKQWQAQFQKAKTAGQRADLLKAVDDERLAKGKEVETLKKFVSKLEQWFIQTLPQDSSTGVAGKKARVQIVSKERPSVMNWDKFYEHIRKNKAFELLNRAPNVRALKERWDQGKQVPGVEKYTYKDVSVTKVN